MVLFQLNLTRIIQIYIVQGLSFLFFLLIVYKSLKKSRKRPLIYFSLFFISIDIGLFFNFIYAPLTNLSLVLTLNFLTNYFIAFGAIFLTVFCIIIYKHHQFNTLKQATLILIYAVLLFLIILIPNGVEISEKTNWHPCWSIYLFLYVIMLLTIMGLIPTLYYSIKILQTFNDETLKKRWRFFIIGTCEYYILTYAVFLSNTLDILIFRRSIAIITLILAITGAIALYYGVIKKF
ncbi:MAG: hypothetical protein ACFFAH_16360 [Promethearchaeota archaeon]